MDTVNRLSPITIILHWVVAISIIGLICLGLYMTKYEQWGLYHTHKSLGLILFGVILVRVLWRVKNGWPVPVSEYSKLEVVLAKSIHWVIIISTVLMPMWGMLHSAASGHGFGIFGLEIFHGNHSLENPSEVIPLSEFWRDFGQQAHKFNGYVLIAGILIHIVGAFKHHFLDKDATLLRMLGRRGP